MRINTLLLTTIILGLAACGNKKNKETTEQKTGAAKPSPMRVDGYIIKPELFQENIEVPGNIVPNEMAEIHPEVSGRIVQLNVAEGKYVGK